MTVIQARSRYPLHKRAIAVGILLVAGLWLSYLLLWPSSSTRTVGMGIPVGAMAPDFELQTIEGESYSLSALQGQVVMINFFATWCTPCRAEMPALQEAYRTLEPQGLVILAVNLDESDVAIRSFQEKLGLTFPIVVDKDDQVARRYDIVPLPTSYFVDRNGIVRAKWTGEIREQQLMAILNEIL